MGSADVMQSILPAKQQSGLLTTECVAQLCMKECRARTYISETKTEYSKDKYVFLGSDFI